jgi:hypothetical protein
MTQELSAGWMPLSVAAAACSASQLGPMPGAPPRELRLDEVLKADVVPELHGRHAGCERDSPEDPRPGAWLGVGKVMQAEGCGLRLSLANTLRTASTDANTTSRATVRPVCPSYLELPVRVQLFTLVPQHLLGGAVDGSGRRRPCERRAHPSAPLTFAKSGLPAAHLRASRFLCMLWMMCGTAHGVRGVSEPGKPLQPRVRLCDMLLDDIGHCSSSSTCVMRPMSAWQAVSERLVSWRTRLCAAYAPCNGVCGSSISRKPLPHTSAIALHSADGRRP